MAAPKVLEILQLFTMEAPRWRVERIAERMGVSSSTAYRCVAELVRGGFLEPVAGGAYVLGPAFIEFDRRMRSSDPLLRAAVPRMDRLGLAMGPAATTVLSRYYRDYVMFVHIERGRDAPIGSYDRGQPIELFSPAAAARAVLMALSDRALRGLYRLRPNEIAAAGLGQSAREFRAAIKAMRSVGWVAGRSVLVAGRFGIGAPIVVHDEVRGSLTVSIPEPASTAEIEHIGRRVLREARSIAAELADDDSEAPRLLGRRNAAPASRPEASLQ